MATNEYAETYTKYRERLRELREKQVDLELQLEDVSREAEGLEGIVKHLAPLAGETIVDDITSVGITQAVRSTLELEEKRSASDVKQKLEDAGFDLSRYAAPDQTIRKVLARLVDAGKASMEKDGWKTFYKYVVTDDDIPF
jgi:hypothetical protein